MPSFGDNTVNNIDVTPIFTDQEGRARSARRVQVTWPVPKTVSAGRVRGADRKAFCWDLSLWPLVWVQVYTCHIPRQRDQVSFLLLCPQPWPLSA